MTSRRHDLRPQHPRHAGHASSPRRPLDRLAGRRVPRDAGASGASSGAPSPSAATSTLLLKVTSEGGFINPAATLAALPIVAVYADGRILTPGPVEAIYPGPLLPPVTVRDVGPSGAAAILAAIRQVGLDKPVDGRSRDPGRRRDERLHAVVDGVTTTSRFSGAPAGTTGPPVRVRRRGARRRARAARPPARPGRDMGRARRRQETTYVPTGYRIYVAPGGPASDPQASQSPVAWPLATPARRLRHTGRGGPRDRRTSAGDRPRCRCRRLSGRSSQRATTLTAFTSGGSSFTLSVRPLLPDELGG